MISIVDEKIFDDDYETYPEHRQYAAGALFCAVGQSTCTKRKSDRAYTYIKPLEGR
jgi:hypothetical protein